MHIGKTHAFGQGGGEGVADERAEHFDAVVDVFGRVAAGAQAFGDEFGTVAGRSVRAGRPSGPPSDAALPAHVLHHPAEPRPTAARVSTRLTSCRVCACQTV